MTDELSRSIENYRAQLQQLSESLKNPRRLEAILIEASHSLITLLENIHSSPIADRPEIREVDHNIQANLTGFLNALEKARHDTRESESRYRTIVESQTELICRITSQGELTFFNEAFRTYFSPYGVIQTGENVINQLSEQDQRLARHYIQSLTPASPVIQMEYALDAPQGETRWLNWTALGYFDAQHCLLEVQAVGHDITERKQSELAAAQHNRELSALHNATVALLSTLDPEALLSRILDAAISAINPADKGMIHLIAKDTGQLEMRASVGYTDPRIIRIRVPTSIGYVARAVHDRTPLLIPDIERDPTITTTPVLEGYLKDVRSAIAAPLILKNQVLGAISLESSQAGAFQESDLRLLVSFAATATAAIHNADLHAEVQKLAITDALTGLYNRRGFYELGQREVERSRRYQRPLVAIMMDIDHFKFINDFYGHSTGDQVLQAVAKRCSENLRRIDILGRFGGDEFTVLLPETDMFTASGVAERVRQTVSNRPIPTEVSPVSVSVSMGVARATAATPDLDILISRADAAMYNAKKEGRNRVEFG